MEHISIEEIISVTLMELCRKEGITDQRISLEIPRDRKYGELSSNVAMIAARRLGTGPLALAEKLAASFPTSTDGVEAVNVAGPGFLNFKLSPTYFHNLLEHIVADPSAFGAADEGRGERWLFEFVSANPTGPLNIVSARAASVGDTLVKVFKKRGYDAHSEYYVNDGGNQIRLLGASVIARIEQTLSGADTADIPEGGYHGRYVLDLASEWLEKHPDMYPPDPKMNGVYYAKALGKWAAEFIRKQHEETLKEYGVIFDRWFRESEMYRSGMVDFAFSELQKSNSTYRKDGAVYFCAGDYGDSEDRVILTSKGDFTYVVPDIAYHMDKRRRGFKKAVDLLGPDHHGHIVQLRAALKAANLPDEFFYPIIVQQVNLKRSGREIKMSKRAGVGITLTELVDEVGVDAARFFFMMRKITSHLDFDIDLACRHSDDNPVYYVQYAHARIQSIFRQPGVRKVTVDSDLSLLTNEEELDLLRWLARFPWTLSVIVRGVDPHPLTGYLTELARSFHLFYTRHRVISDDTALTAARLTLCRGVAGVLSEGLSLMGVSAPDMM